MLQHSWVFPFYFQKEIKRRHESRTRLKNALEKADSLSESEEGDLGSEHLARRENCAKCATKEEEECELGFYQFVTMRDLKLFLLFFFLLFFLFSSYFASFPCFSSSLLSLSLCCRRNLQGAYSPPFKTLMAS